MSGFYCPVEPAINPHVGVTEVRATEWLDRVGLGADPRLRAEVVRLNVAEFFARAAPEADDEPMQVAVRWACWAHLFLRERGGDEDFMTTAGEVQRALEVPWHAVAEDRFALALQDIALAMHGCASGQQARRFADAHRAWLFTAAWQASLDSMGLAPSLDDHVMMRLNAASGAPTAALLEIAVGEEVPAHEADSPPVRALSEMAVLVTGWDTDLHTGGGVVEVLAEQGRTSVERATEQARAMRDRVLMRFLDLREQVLIGPVSEALRGYLASLGHAIRGNIDWALGAPRFVGFTEAPAVPGQRGREWADSPTDADPSPLPIAAIAWWWDDM
ncbi:MULTISPECIES: hypothetical protein [Actinosynnema]|uniref:terpene synthase family protein n=1 Tax=Actinosynnema TaxID=40566 RepID=UPI0020A30D90|nr:hypothetical protein [Actinosynnema pretiosum]MCP2098186.1 hypothetical protein [Actinosynnema pretiosum]